MPYNEAHVATITGPDGSVKMVRSRHRKKMEAILNRTMMPGDDVSIVSITGRARLASSPLKRGRGNLRIPQALR